MAIFKAKDTDKLQKLKSCVNCDSIIHSIKLSHMYLNKSQNSWTFHARENSWFDSWFLSYILDLERSWLAEHVQLKGTVFYLTIWHICTENYYKQLWQAIQGGGE